LQDSLDAHSYDCRTGGLIGTFLFLWIFGFSINLLTLSAMLLAIAIVVDDAIVVVEAVHPSSTRAMRMHAKLPSMPERDLGAIISITW
jgi:HAE1 family hydrophobic/amphiphilic exporter-1